MNALAYQADPSCVDPAKLSPTPQRGGRRRSQARSMSVQSSLDPYGSSTTLNSESASSEIESSPRLSSDGSRGSPLGRLSNWNHTKYSLNVLRYHSRPQFLNVLNRKCQHHLHNPKGTIYIHILWDYKSIFPMFLGVIDHCETVLNVNTGVVLRIHS